MLKVVQYKKRKEEIQYKEMFKISVVLSNSDNGEIFFKV